MSFSLKAIHIVNQHLLGMVASHSSNLTRRSLFILDTNDCWGLLSGKVTVGFHVWAEIQLEFAILQFAMLCSTLTGWKVVWYYHPTNEADFRIFRITCFLNPSQ